MSLVKQRPLPILAEVGVRFPAIRRRYVRAHPCPVGIAAVARQQASATPVIRARSSLASAPPFGANVMLGGAQRLEPKLHRSWPGGRCPARAVCSLQVDPPRIPCLRQPTRQLDHPPPPRPPDRNATSILPSGRALARAPVGGGFPAPPFRWRGGFTVPP